MRVNVNNKEYVFDGYAQPLQSIQRLAEECYQQGITDIVKEMRNLEDENYCPYDGLCRNYEENDNDRSCITCYLDRIEQLNEGAEE